MLPSSRSSKTVLTGCRIAEAFFGELKGDVAGEEPGDIGTVDGLDVFEVKWLGELLSYRSPVQDSFRLPRCA